MHLIKTRNHVFSWRRGEPTHWVPSENVGRLAIDQRLPGTFYHTLTSLYLFGPWLSRTGVDHLDSVKKTDLMWECPPLFEPPLTKVVTTQMSWHPSPLGKSCRIAPPQQPANQMALAWFRQVMIGLSRPPFASWFGVRCSEVASTDSLTLASSLSVVEMFLFCDDSKARPLHFFCPLLLNLQKKHDSEPNPVLSRFPTARPRSSSLLAKVGVIL